MHVTLQGLQGPVTPTSLGKVLVGTWAVFVGHPLPLGGLAESTKGTALVMGTRPGRAQRSWLGGVRSRDKRIAGLGVSGTLASGESKPCLQSVHPCVDTLISSFTSWAPRHEGGSALGYRGALLETGRATSIADQKRNFISISFLLFRKAFRQ